MADMRTVRTRGYLCDALIALLREKPYADVTVREVAQRAQVSKNSFYNHYADLDALVQDCWLRESVYFGRAHKRLGDYDVRQEACAETLDEGARMLLFFRENPNLARVILDNVCVSPYFAEFRQAEEELLIDHLETMYGEPVKPYLNNDACARFITWGVFGSYRKWFMGGMAEPIETVVKATMYLAFQGLAGAVGRPIEAEYLQVIDGWQFDEDAAREGRPQTAWGEGR